LTIPVSCTYILQFFTGWDATFSWQTISGIQQCTEWWTWYRNFYFGFFAHWFQCKSA